MKSHEIWGYFEAILRVLELIIVRGGVEHPPTSNKVNPFLVTFEEKKI